MHTFALVGRPNVGKSALFNRICRKRISIVAEEEGVTRDRIYTEGDHFGAPFRLIDTGGIDPYSKAPFSELIRTQALIATEEADVLIMVVDAQIGPTNVDKEMAKFFLSLKKPLILAVNKIDDIGQEALLAPFYSLGISCIISVSAVHGYQISELLDQAFSFFSSEDREEEQEVDDETFLQQPSRIKLTIVGKPNVGKSTLFNAFLEQNRSMVSTIAGTTRDAIYEPLGEDFVLVDTAGLKRKQKERDVIEKFASVRTEEAIEQADLCLFLLDSYEGISVQEKKIANLIEEKGKGCILIFNKWDLVKKMRMEHAAQAVKAELAFLEHCPCLFISAEKGRNLEKILPLAKSVYAEGRKRITTGKLNNFIEKAIQKNHPPMLQGRRLRIYYMVQVGVAPPTFILFVNDPELVVDSYKKYLINQLREEFGFVGSPLVFHVKARKEEKKEMKENSASFSKKRPIIQTADYQEV